MPENVAYPLHSMDASASFEDADYDQHDALLGEELPDQRVKRDYKNSDRTLVILGAIGTCIILGLTFVLVYLLFGPTRSSSESSFRPPKWGDIGCEFPGEILSPLLEQNLTLYENKLEIITTGTSVGDIMFHTEPEDELEYVRLDVSLQGPLKSDLQAVYTRVRAGRYELQSPELPQKCMRYTLDIWLPKRLTSLTVRTETLAHISFGEIDPASSIYGLNVKLGGDAQKNLLVLPEARITNAEFSLNDGYILGTTLLYNTLKFDAGQAQVDAEVVLMHNQDSLAAEVHDLNTLTSTQGLHKIVVKNPNMYPIYAFHESTDATKMELEYPATFNGEISTIAQALTTENADIDIPKDGVVFKGSQSEPRSNLRIHNDLGSVILAFA